MIQQGETYTSQKEMAQLIQSNLHMFSFFGKALHIRKRSLRTFLTVTERTGLPMKVREFLDG